MACAPSKDSDQPGHPPSLIRVFAVCMKKAWVLSYPMSTQQRLWSDWADAQADLFSLGIQSFCWFCHEAAQMCTSHTHAVTSRCTLLGIYSQGTRSVCSELHVRHFKLLEFVMLIVVLSYVSLVMRKPVFGVCNQVTLKPACSDSETS